MIYPHRKVCSAQVAHYTNVVLNVPCMDGKLAGNPPQVTSVTIISDSSIACGGVDLFGGSPFCCICLVQPTVCVFVCVCVHITWRLEE